MRKSKQGNGGIRSAFRENSSACRVDEDWQGIGLEAGRPLEGCCDNPREQKRP